MPSVQDRTDLRSIPLDAVGVSGATHPVRVAVKPGSEQTTPGVFRLTVPLSAELRGTHLSRYTETLGTQPVTATPEGLTDLLERLRTSLGTASARAEIAFTALIERTAPESGLAAMRGCPVRIDARLGDALDYTLTVATPVLTVCPCSQEATDGPGHSQRGRVTVSVRYVGRVTIEELVQLAEDAASAPVYPLLKSSDERAVLERAYEQPVFVEDVVRAAAERLDADVRVHWYRVSAENLESVTDHNVCAAVERSRDGRPATDAATSRMGVRGENAEGTSEES